MMLQQGLLDFFHVVNYYLILNCVIICRVLDIENRSKEPYKILPHPSFLYTAKFHPNSIEIICTSGYDKVIRIWSISSVSKNQKYGQLLQEMYGHNGFVNTTCFSADGSILYSADSNGKILIWNCNSTSGSKEKFKEWTIKHEIEIDELKVNICL